MLFKAELHPLHCLQFTLTVFLGALAAAVVMLLVAKPFSCNRISHPYLSSGHDSRSASETSGTNVIFVLFVVIFVSAFIWVLSLVLQHHLDKINP